MCGPYILKESGLAPNLPAKVEWDELLDLMPHPDPHEFKRYLEHKYNTEHFSALANFDGIYEQAVKAEKAETKTEKLRRSRIAKRLATDTANQRKKVNADARGPAEAADTNRQLGMKTRATVAQLSRGTLTYQVLIWYAREMVEYSTGGEKRSGRGETIAKDHVVAGNRAEQMQPAPKVPQLRRSPRLRRDK